MYRLAFIPLGLLLLLVLGSILSMFFKLDWETVRSIFVDKEIAYAVSLSIASALISLLLATIISIPAAWVMARYDFVGKRILDIVLDLPLVIPPLVVGMALLMFLGHSGPVGKLFPFIADNLFSPMGVIIAQTYVACAILVRTAISAFISINENYINASYNLGLTPIKTFIFVEIPLCWRALLGGCIMALSRSLGEFGATLMLAGATRMKTETLPIAIYINLSGGSFIKAVACACLLMIIAFILLFVLHAVQKTRFSNVSSAKHI